jgi:monooxygenase
MALMPLDHVDVLIVGAGLSGIGAAHHLQAECPGKTYAILEARERIGGTWDLFRYPGVRSDSDMCTLGYAFRPWTEAKSIADGPSILRHIGADGERSRHRPPHSRPARPARRRGSDRGAGVGGAAVPGL